MISQKELANLDYWHKKTLSFFDKVDRFNHGKPENILQQCMEILRPEDVRARFRRCISLHGEEHGFS